MRSFTRRPLTVCATVLGAAAIACSLVAGPAQAAQVASSDSDVAAIATSAWDRINASGDPHAAYLALSANDRAAFDAYLLPAHAEESVTLTPADDAARAAVASGAVKTRYDSVDAGQTDTATTSGCWGSYARYTEKAALGNSLWDTYTEGGWCTNGSTVTSATFNRSWSTVAAVGWRDGGQLGKGSGIVSNQARIWSQRRMILGAGGWDVQTRNPCIRLNGSSSGGASASQTCSLY
jgi:hypothetical protein